MVPELHFTAPVVSQAWENGAGNVLMPLLIAGNGAVCLGHEVPGKWFPMVETPGRNLKQGSPLRMTMVHMSFNDWYASN